MKKKGMQILFGSKYENPSDNGTQYNIGSPLNSDVYHQLIFTTCRWHSGPSHSICQRPSLYLDISVILAFSIFCPAKYLVQYWHMLSYHSHSIYANLTPHSTPLHYIWAFQLFFLSLFFAQQNIWYNIDTFDHISPATKDPNSKPT